MKNFGLIFTSVIISGLTVLFYSQSCRAQEDPHLRYLEERIKALETLVQPPEITEAESAPENKPLLFETLQEKKFLEGIEIIPGVALSGLLEVEVEYEKIDRKEGEDEESSDLKLSTFELGVDVDAIKYVHAHALLLWEEDDTEPIDLDEGIITLGAEEDFPYYLSAGKLYVPFGVFESHFISDPLILELGETRETAVMLGYEDELVSASLGAFKGDVKKAGKDSHINNLVASLGINPIESLSLGLSWISDIADSDGLTDLIPENEDGDREVDEFVGGISGIILIELEPLAISGEYLGALKKFKDIPVPGEEPSELEGMKPRAWNIELSWVFQEDWEAALRYEGSDDFPEFPENQCGICVSWGIFPNTSLSAEYLYGEFKNDDKRNLTTAQLALEF